MRRRVSRSCRRSRPARHSRDPARHSALLGVPCWRPASRRSSSRSTPTRTRRTSRWCSPERSRRRPGSCCSRPRRCASWRWPADGRHSRPRIALRDLRRHQARSGAALAAITLGLAIAVTIVVVAAAAEDGAAEGNLASSQLLIRVGGSDLETPEIDADELDIDARHGRRHRFAARRDSVVPLQVAVDPNESMTIGCAPPDRQFRRMEGEREHVPRRRCRLRTTRSCSPTSASIRRPSSPTPSCSAPSRTTSCSSSTFAVPDEGRDPLAGVQRITTSDYSSVPRSMITATQSRRQGLAVTHHRLAARGRPAVHRRGAA